MSSKDVYHLQQDLQDELDIYVTGGSCVPKHPMEADGAISIKHRGGNGWLGQCKQLHPKTIPADIGKIGTMPLMLTPWEHDYLRERFIRNNHPKYHKYCEEWVLGVTKTQLHYFVEEAHRTGWQRNGLRGKPKINP